MIVKLPDGNQAEFPDDMPHDQITSVLSKQYPSSPVENDLMKVDLEAGVDKGWDRIGANVQAGYTGILSLGSSMAKIADKMGLAPKGTAQKVQSAYDEAEKIYQSGTYPETAVSKFAGGMLVPGGLPVKMGAKLGGLALGKAGEYLGAAAGGSVAGGVLGGLTNTEGNSPDDLWNEDAAKTGAILGAPLGAAGNLVSKWGKNAAGYQVGKEELEQVGYKGPVLARDYGSEAIAQVKSNWMDNIVASGIRAEQLGAITPAIKSLLGKVTQASEMKGTHRVGQIIRGVNHRLETESGDNWNALFDAAKQQGISKIDTTLTKQASADIIKEYGSEFSKKNLDILNTLSRSKQVDFGVLNKVKGNDIWKMSEKFGKRDGSVNENISNSLQDLYWNITDDIGNTLKSNPELTSSWASAREFTKGVKDIFNVKNNSKLVKAIDDIHENTGHLQTFVNSVLKPPTSTASKYYNESLGASYQKGVSDLSFNKIFNDSFSSEANGLNLNKFFSGVKESDAAGLLDNPTVKALSVLEKHYNKIMMTEEAAKTSTAAGMKSMVPYAQTVAVGGGFMAGGIPGAAAALGAVVVGPKVLGMISKASPLKNLLLGASQVYGKNPKLTEYLMSKVGDKLTQAGVLITTSPEGIKLENK